MVEGDSGIVACADPGIFVRGGPGQSDKKSSDNLFFFKSSANFKEVKWSILNKIYHSSRFQRGPTLSRGGGGSNFFQRGSNCLFPIESHITCDFPGGGVRTPCPPPLDLHLSSLFILPHLVLSICKKDDFAFKFQELFTLGC